ncbi:zinc finger protein DPF3-like isoform X1 [Tachypleus tridentatus]|uniref:zinc finger protein DPF3-like isoform X1 n=1 Tax=Tachypleus tridentatus TaxID=6853 RepID=UPI003FD12B56
MSGTDVSLNTEAIERLESILNDSFYREAVESSANYNTRLCIERKTRLPFLDAQTGVAQSDSSLWMPKWQRMPGQNFGQLYSYPVKRWKKKRWQYLMNDRYIPQKVKDADHVSEADTSHIAVVENLVTRLEEGEENSVDKVTEDSKDSWCKDFEDVIEPPELGEPEDLDSDYDEFEESYSRRKKKKVRTTRGKRKGERVEYSQADKPYSCEICGARYKTRPGLSYHYSHSHNNSDTADEEQSYASPKSTTSKPTSSTSSAGGSADDPLAGLRKFQDSFLSFLKKPGNDQKSASGKPMASPSPYCDFCLGDNVENKKTRQAEELVSCADCGRSAHPTCLQFTPNMTISVKKYRWQCIECKSCGLCGTSDNDDQLLFCDDCDRGYHMYCLNPPLSEPPEGSWSCHLCIEEYHGGMKIQ